LSTLAAAAECLRVGMTPQPASTFQVAVSRCRIWISGGNSAVPCPPQRRMVFCTATITAPARAQGPFGTRSSDQTPPTGSKDHRSLKKTPFCPNPPKMIILPDVSTALCCHLAQGRPAELSSVQICLAGSMQYNLFCG
jgi:hypothetical protein